MEGTGNISQSSAVLLPGVKSSYKNGWAQLWKYFLELFLIGIIYLLLAELFAIPQWFLMPSLLSLRPEELSSQGFRDALSLLGGVYSILVITPLMYGVSLAYLKAARGDKLEIKDMFEGFKTYWNAVLANLLVTGIVLIGLVLLIIPGVIFGIKLSFTPYLVVDRKMKVIEAVKESWRMTGGHAWQIFLIELLGIPIMIAGLLVLLVGIIPAMMWVSLASASLYHAVSLTRNTPPQPPA